MPESVSITKQIITTCVFLVSISHSQVYAEVDNDKNLLSEDDIESIQQLLESDEAKIKEVLLEISKHNEAEEKNKKETLKKASDAYNQFKKLSIEERFKADKDAYIKIAEQEIKENASKKCDEGVLSMDETIINLIFTTDDGKKSSDNDAAQILTQKILACKKKDIFAQFH